MRRRAAAVLLAASGALACTTAMAPPRPIGPLDPAVAAVFERVAPEVSRHVHKVSVRVGGRDLVMTGYLALDRRHGFRAVAVDEFGGKMLDLVSCDGERSVGFAPPQLSPEILERGPLADLELIYLPPPIEVATALWEMGSSGMIPFHVSYTFYRVGISFAIAMGLSLVLGLLIGRSSATQGFLERGVVLIQSVPAAIWIVVAIIWFGISDLAPNHAPVRPGRLVIMVDSANRMFRPFRLLKSVAIGVPKCGVERVTKLAVRWPICSSRSSATSRTPGDRSSLASNPPVEWPMKCSESALSPPVSVTASSRFTDRRRMDAVGWVSSSMTSAS